MIELFDHTADLGIRVTAPDLPTLFAEMAAGLVLATVEDPQSVRPADECVISVVGTDREYLLFDWLRELLYRFDADGFLCASAIVAMTADGLTATVRGETVDRTRHVLTHEVKAITYHGLKVEDTPTGFLAEVIVDI